MEADDNESRSVLLNADSSKKKKLPLKSSSPSKSPERCPICLSPPENKAITDTCFHAFCFSCLKEWSKVKVECPLCKSKFRHIIYNVVADDDYDEFLVPVPLENDNEPHERLYHRLSHWSSNEPSFGFSNWMLSHMQEWREQIQLRQENTRAATMACTDVELIRRRRQHYRNGTMVVHVDNNKQVRDISTTFYQDNPAQLHRLVPWLKRELVILFGANSVYLVNCLCDTILGSIRSVGITSSEFYALIHPYFGEMTDHFINELISYAKSPHDLSSYDRHAHYACRNQSHNRNNDSERSLRDQSLMYSLTYVGALPPPLADTVNKVLLIDRQKQRKNVSRRYKRRYRKWNLDFKPKNLPKEIIVINSSSSDNEESSHPRLPSSSKPASSRKMIPSKSWSSSDDDDVQIVSFQKPPHLRTPEAIIELSSSCSETDKPGPSTSSKRSEKPQTPMKNESSDSNSEDSSSLPPRVKSVIVPIVKERSPSSPGSSLKRKKLQKVRYCKLYKTDSKSEEICKRKRRRKRSRSGISSSSAIQTDSSSSDSEQERLRIFRHL
ncbi:uncharacterized protein LOC100178429 [Ciona intestinalis]